VAAVPPAGLDPDGVERDVEFVVQHDQPGLVELVEAQQRRDGAAGQIHERVRLGEHQLRSAGCDPPLCDCGVGLMRLERRRAVRARADPTGEFGERHLADVVAMPGVAGPGIPEPGHKPDVF
jgi:hypothetical protein